MKTQSINNSVSAKGLYFTKSSTVLFNKSKEIKFLKSDFKTSEQGVRYIEDGDVAQSVRERFANIPFLRDLAKKFDVFVFFRELPVGHRSNYGTSHMAFSKISWAEYGKKKSTDTRVVTGNSPISQEIATEKMFKNLESKNFSEIA